MTELAARGLTIAKGGRTLLRDISLSIGPAGLVAVIGANGAGKSTLLTALAGLSRPNAGRVTLDHVPLLSLDPKVLARRRAYLPQSPRAEWPISVERLIALGLIPQLPAFGGLPAPLQQHIGEMIVTWDLEDHRDQPATTLSGGELARAMLARALIGAPDILIADEPLAGLDPRHALDTIARLRALADHGKLVIVSIHDLTLAARYAHRIVALHHGEVVADGPTAEVLTPALLDHVFEVEACVSGTGEGAFVDFVAVTPRRAKHTD